MCRGNDLRCNRIRPLSPATRSLGPRNSPKAQPTAAFDAVAARVFRFNYVELFAASARSAIGACLHWAAISTDRRNTCIETLGGCFVVKRFSRSFVELSGNGTQLCLTMYRQIGAFWKVLSQRKRPFALTAAKFALGTTAERTFRPFVGVAATLENGPLPPLNLPSGCCGAARQTGLSLRPRTRGSPEFTQRGRSRRSLHPRNQASCESSIWKEGRRVLIRCARREGPLSPRNASEHLIANPPPLRLPADRWSLP